MKKVAFALTLLLAFSTLAFAGQFYASNFENDAIGSSPSGWELGFVGAGNGLVVADPLDPNNQIFAHTDLAMDMARHDVGGNVWVVSGLEASDYIIEYDAYFPADFYIGVLFRFVDSETFYLFDRRIGGAPESPTFDFWRHGEGNWTNVASGANFPAAPEQWYSFRLVIEGDTFKGYAKEKGDTTPFAAMEPFIEGSDGTIEMGKVGLYGLIYIDNMVIGETEDDLVIAPVEAKDKLAITWGAIK